MRSGLRSTRVIVMFWPGLLPKPMSGSVALQQQWSVVSDGTKGQEDSWACHSMAATLGRIGLACYLLQHSREQVLHLGVGSEER